MRKKQIKIFQKLFVFAERDFFYKSWKNGKMRGKTKVMNIRKVLRSFYEKKTTYFGVLKSFDVFSEKSFHSTFTFYHASNFSKL
jgi:predicted transcriptional regulator